MKKMLKRLTNNFGLKVLSVFFAVVMWLVVVNIDDPQRTVKFTIPISVENESYLTNLGKYYQIDGDVNTITISVTGKRTTIEKLNANDFKAAVNMENVEDSCQVKIEVSALRFVNQLTITQKIDYLPIKIGNLAMKRFVISPQTTGTPTEGAAVGDISLNRNLLKVSGPEEKVAKIASASVVVNVDGIATDITDEVIPELYDENGEKIDMSDLNLNMQTIQVTVHMLEVKAVPLNFQVSGTPENGYRYNRTSFEPKKIRVKGAPEQLNNINSISVPKEVLDITGATGNIEKTVDITSYLPDGINLVNAEDAKIAVVVYIDSQETRTYNMPTANIKINNLAEHFELKFAAESVKVSITGFSSDLDAIDANTLIGTIDVSGLPQGTSSVALSIENEGNYSIAATNVVIYLTDKSGEEQTTAPKDEEPAKAEDDTAQRKDPVEDTKSKADQKEDTSEDDNADKNADDDEDKDREE